MTTIKHQNTQNMKQQLFAFVLLAGLAACEGGNSNADAVSGKYHRHLHDEYGDLWDTLVVTRLNESATATFRVEQRITEKKRKLDDTTWLPLQQRQKEFTGIFNPDEQTLEIKEKGSLYSFDKKNSRLTHGAVIYEKVKGQ